MATAKRFNESGEGGSAVELSDELFGAEIHEQALYETVKSYLAHQRQGTAKTKERGEVVFLHRQALSSEGNRPRARGIDEVSGA